MLTRTSRRTRAALTCRAILQALEPRLLLSTTLLSINSAGTAATGSAGLLLPANASNFSPDGRFVLFTSSATNLVSGITDTNNAPDLFLRDLQTGTTAIISADATGHALGSSAFSSLVFSPDSRFLAFKTASPSIVAGITDTNGLADLFLRNLTANTTSVVSVNAAGTSTGNGAVLTDLPVFSPDSHALAFVSQATNLVNNVTDTTAQDVFLRDLQTNSTSLISINPTGTASGLNVSQGPLAFSPDGRYLAFDSQSAGLVTGFTGFNGNDNLYVRDRQTNTTFLLTRNTLNQATNFAPSANPFSYQFAPSSDTLYFTSSGANMVAGVSDTNQGQDIFAWNASSNAISMLSVTPDGASAGTSASTPVGLSPDGRFLVFTSASTNLTPQSAGGDNKADLYVRDLQTGTTSYVATNATSSVAFPQPLISPDSVNLLFQSDATNVIPGITDTNGLTDLFLYNMLTGATTAATVNSAGTATANATSFGDLAPSFSPDGRYLAFSSDATNLAPGVTSNHTLLNLYVRDLQTNTTTLVSQGFNNTDAGFNPNTLQTLFTPDSKFLVFSNDGSVLNPISTPITFNFKTNLYAFNLSTHAITLLNPDFAGTAMSNGSVSAIAINPANGSVLFTSVASDLVTGTTDTTSNQTTATDVFLTTISPNATTSSAAHASLTGLTHAIATGDTTASTTDGTDFGTTPVNTAVSHTFTLTNTGAADLITANLQLPAGFTLTEPLNATIVPGASDSFTIRFDAAAAGTSSGNVSFTTNDTAASAFSFAVTATAGAAASGTSDLVIEGGVTSVKTGNFIGGTKGGKASVRVFNRGTGAVTGNLRVVFYASQDNTLDPSDTPLVPVNKKVNLTTNKNAVFTGSFNYPTGLPAGQYFILAKIDDNNAFPESNETNNVATSLATIGIAPPTFDLSATSLVATGKFTFGKPAAAALTLLNTGNVNAAGTVTFSFVLSPDTILGNGDDLPLTPTTIKNLSIKPGAKNTKKVTLKATLTNIPPGTYTLFSVIDSTNVLSESNEANNTIQTATTITVS